MEAPGILYEDQFNASGGDLCGIFDGLFPTNVDRFCNVQPLGTFETDAFVTGSEVERFGLGVVQEIDSAAMHLFARWQHQSIDVDLTGVVSSIDPLNCGPGDCAVSFERTRVKQSFEDWDLFQIGGIIFF